MITIRKAIPEDAIFIAAHAHRMLDFKLPGWRANEKDMMVQADINHLTKVLQTNDENSSMFIAEDESKTPLAFLRVNYAGGLFYRRTTCTCK